MALAMAEVTLALLLLLVLCLLFLELPGPRRGYCAAAVGLLIVQTGAVDGMLDTADRVFPPQRPGLSGLEDASWVVGALVVPPAGALLLTLVILSLLQARRRVIARARAQQLKTIA